MIGAGVLNLILVLQEMKIDMPVQLLRDRGSRT